MLPEERVHPLIIRSVLRYLSYHWGTAMIQNLIRCRFGVRISSRCIRTIQSGASCTEHCLSDCPFQNVVM